MVSVRSRKEFISRRRTNYEDPIQASVVGKRVGRYKWSPTTSKTLEGSAGFTISVVASAWVLRLCGLVEEFSVSEFTSERDAKVLMWLN